MNEPVQINIVVPLYNEEAVFEELQQRLAKLMDNSDLAISVIMIDDGSKDQTPKLMEQLAFKDPRFSSVFLSRNFGHQLALSAVLSCVDASEAVFIIDGDLQDPPELLFDFYEYFKKGYDVVYAVRKKRKESLFKRIAYNQFYRILKNIAYTEIPLDSGDFSLVSRRVVDELNSMREESRYLRGMRSWIGFKQIGVKYERFERQAGDSKYSIKNLLQLAFNGIFNFSKFPVKLISTLGIFTIIISLAYFVFTIIKQIFYGAVPEGFTGLIFTITLFGGVQLLSLGILGEYILRIFFQVKDRPLYIIDRQIKKGKEL